MVNQPLFSLFIALTAFIVGPLALTYIKSNKGLLHLIDGFSVVVISGLVFAHILPEKFSDLGFISVFIMLAGLLLPNLLEKIKNSRFANQTHRFTLFTALFGLVLHDVTDGLALSATLGESLNHVHDPLTAAIIIHRVPMGFIVWWLIKPNYGSLKAIAMITVLMLATTLGYFMGHSLHDFFNIKGVQIFESFMAGSLLHVIFHRHNSFESDHAPKWNWAEGIGALCGLIFLIGPSFGHFWLSLNGHSASKELNSFIRLASESAPALLIAYILAGAASSFIPESSVSWMNRGKTITQSIKGMLFGLPLPICSCGVVPLYHSLIKKGASMAAATAFFIATPELGLDALLLTIPLLGTKFAIVRLIVAALIALLVGWFIGRNFTNSRTTNDNKSTEQQTLRGKFNQAVKTGLQDVVDHTGPWIVLGLILASLMEPLLQQHNLAGLIPFGWDVLLFSLLGIPVYVCATGATPLVAVLLYNGLSPGAALAFLITGPATNITTFGVLSNLHCKKLVISFASSIIFLASLFGILVNLTISPSLSFENTSLHHHQPSIVQLVCLFGLAMLFVFAILRRGPRYLINQIITFEGGHDHDTHDHSHEHTHSKNLKHDHNKSSCCH